MCQGTRHSFKNNNSGHILHIVSFSLSLFLTLSLSLSSIKHACTHGQHTLSVPHSVSHSACVIIILICERCKPDIFCKLPAVGGDCRASIPRFFYNPKSGKCEQFTYGGCGGNANNFLSEDECLKTCGNKITL
jgi:hypothetical protein